MDLSELQQYADSDLSAISHLPSYSDEQLGILKGTTRLVDCAFLAAPIHQAAAVGTRHLTATEQTERGINKILNFVSETQKLHEELFGTVSVRSALNLYHHTAAGVSVGATLGIDTAIRRLEEQLLGRTTVAAAASIGSFAVDAMGGVGRIGKHSSACVLLSNVDKAVGTFVDAFSSPSITAHGITHHFERQPQIAAGSMVGRSISVFETKYTAAVAITTGKLSDSLFGAITAKNSLYTQQYKSGILADLHVGLTSKCAAETWNQRNGLLGALQELLIVSRH